MEILMEKPCRNTVLTIVFIVALTATFFTVKLQINKAASAEEVTQPAADEAEDQEYMTEIKEGMLSDFLSGSPLSRDIVLSSNSMHIDSYLDSMVETGTADESDVTHPASLTDGCYHISLFESEMFLSAGADRLSLTKDSGGLTACFRLEAAGNCAYRLYALTGDDSAGLPIVADTDGGCLRIADAESEATELYITAEDTNDGTRYITLRNSGGVKVGAKNTVDSQSLTLASSWDASLSLKWTLKKATTLSPSGAEVAMYPADMLYVTQDAFTGDSHVNQNAIDIKTYVSSSIFAPFSSRIVEIMPQYGNTVFLESLGKVLYADGTYDYMTVAFMHDDDISDIPLGRVLYQGEYFYDMGVAGVAEGSHVHISVFRGQYDESMALTGIVDSSIFAENAFTVQSGIYVRSTGGIDWTWTEE